MGRKGLGLWLLLALPSAAIAANGTDDRPDESPKVFRTFAKVEIGPAGDVVSVSPELRFGSEIGSAIEKSVRALSFAPAAVDGRPVAGTTYVRMMGCAAPIGQGDYRLAFEYTSHGPGYSQMPHPTYPASALRSGISGHFDVAMTVQPDGTMRLDEVATVQGGARAKRAFAESIGAWVAALRYEPETVAGKAVATSVSVPLEFNIGERRWKVEAEKMRAKEVQSDACQLAFGRERAGRKEPVAFNSPFTLKPGT